MTEEPFILGGGLLGFNVVSSLAKQSRSIQANGNSRRGPSAMAPSGHEFVLQLGNGLQKIPLRENSQISCDFSHKIKFCVPLDSRNSDER